MEYTVKVDIGGTVRYYKPGTDVLHREDGPAEVHTDGEERWFIDGKLHRKDGPAFINSNGYKSWIKKGKWHREDGPARVWRDGSEQWFVNGALHREDGPAIVRADGTQKWYIDGKELSEEEFKNRTKETNVRTFTVPANTSQICIQIE